MEAQNALVEAANDKNLSNTITMATSNSGLKTALEDLRKEYIKQSMEQSVKNLKTALATAQQAGADKLVPILKAQGFTQEEALKLQKIQGEKSLDKQNEDLKNFLTLKAEADASKKLQDQYGKTYEEMLKMSEKQLGELIKTRSENKDNAAGIADAVAGGMEVKYNEAILKTQGYGFFEQKARTATITGTPTPSATAIEKNTGTPKSEEKAKVETQNKETSTGITNIADATSLQLQEVKRSNDLTQQLISAISSLNVKMAELVKKA